MTKAKKKVTTTPSYKIVHWILFLLVLVNLFVVFRFERDRVPRIVREEILTVSNHVFIVTNVIRSVSSASSDSHDASIYTRTNSQGRLIVNDPEYEIPLQYHFFQSGTKYFIQIAGFTFGVGDMTSYGRIKSIFPERVLLDNGYFLKNDKFDERFGFSRDSLQLRRDMAAFNSSGTNYSLFVPQVALTKGNFNNAGSGASVGSRVRSTNSVGRLRR